MPDTISTSPADGTHIFDDFFSNAAVSTGLVGQLDWLLTAIGGDATPSYVASQNGVLRLTTGSGSGAGTAVHLMESKLELEGGNGVFCRFRIRLTDDIAGHNFKIGFNGSVAIADGVGIWIEGDSGVLSLKAESTNGNINTNVTGVSTLTSGTTMVVDTWHDFEFRCSGTNSNSGPESIECLVDGEVAASIRNFLLASTELMEYSIVAWDDAATAQKFDIDYYEAYIPRV